MMANQKEIAKACFLEAGSLTTILNKMEEKGLIEQIFKMETDGVFIFS